jgi:uncharacterized integral membrane protein
MSKITTIVSNVQLMLLIIALILFTFFLLQNTGAIQVNFLAFEIQIPTVILILVSTLIGFFGSYLLHSDSSDRKITLSNIRTAYFGRLLSRLS